MIQACSGSVTKSHGQALSALGNSAHNPRNFLPLGCRLSALGSPSIDYESARTETVMEQSYKLTPLVRGANALGAGGQRPNRHIS